MVRLKEKPENRSNTGLSHFNSTMVRLKVSYLAGRKDKRKFQFHYGTIKRVRGWSEARRDIPISIPLWYD